MEQMRNIVDNHSSTKEKTNKKIYNLKVEKLVRQANDTFVYFRDYETALDQINEALKIEPDHTKALILKGDLLFCIDKDSEALEYFDKALDANPFSAEAYGSKAGTLDILGRKQEALFCCEKAFENVTQRDRHLLPSLYDQKIALLIRMKKYEEAKDTLNNCVRNLPDEDGSYLMSCYKRLIENSCKEKLRKRQMLEKMALKLVNN